MLRDSNRIKMVNFNSIYTLTFNALIRETKSPQLPRHYIQNANKTDNTPRRDYYVVLDSLHGNITFKAYE